MGDNRRGNGEVIRVKTGGGLREEVISGCGLTCGLVFVPQDVGRLHSRGGQHSVQIGQRHEETGQSVAHDQW